MCAPVVRADPSWRVFCVPRHAGWTRLTTYTVSPRTECCRVAYRYSLRAARGWLGWVKRPVIMHQSLVLYGWLDTYGMECNEREDQGGGGRKGGGKQTRRRRRKGKERRRGTREQKKKRVCAAMNLLLVTTSETRSGRITSIGKPGQVFNGWFHLYAHSVSRPSLCISFSPILVCDSAYRYLSPIHFFHPSASLNMSAVFSLGLSLLSSAAIHLYFTF